MRLRDEYEVETGAQALYRKNSADFHTLRYVDWLELRVEKAEAELAECRKENSLLRKAWKSTKKWAENVEKEHDRMQKAIEALCRKAERKQNVRMETI